MHRVGRHHEVDQHRAQKDQVFNGVHRQARPRADIDVAVVQRVHMFVKERNVQEAVDPVEIKAFPDRYQQEERDEPDRVRGPGDHRGIAVGHGPEQKHLIGRPDRHAAGQRPEHVVPDLAPERELFAILHQRARIVFQPLPLLGESIKVKVQATCDEGHQEKVAHIHLGHPADRQRSGLFERWLEKGHRDEGDADNDQPFGDQEPRVPEPCQHSTGSQRPREEGRDLQRYVGNVVPAFERCVGHCEPLAKCGGCSVADSLSRQKQF